MSKRFAIVVGDDPYWEARGTLDVDSLAVAVESAVPTCDDSARARGI